MVGIFDFLKKPIQELYIARPEEAANHLIWMHPDRTIPRGAKLKIRSDEVAVFFRNGRVAGTLEAGDYLLDSGNIPFLGELIVDPLTDGNHYLAELFFVRRAEFLQKSGLRKLGSHQDLTSGHFLTLTYDIQFGVKVTDPVALITTLGGMEATSAEKVGEFLNGRIRSHLAATAGNLISQVPIPRVVSNQFNEQIGQEVQKQVEDQFGNQGLKLTRFVSMTLALDEESEDLLREFSSARADLAIQREGSQIANNPGFANFHLAQGQRSALEGLGEGMASGGNSAPILGVGLGLGMGGMGGGSVPSMGFQSSPDFGSGGMGAPGGGGGPVVSRSSSKVPSQMRWYLKTERGTEGPYSIRQLVLRALAEDETADTAMVRGENDPEWYAASEESALLKEFERRIKNRTRTGSGEAPKKPAQNKTETFETLFRIAVEDEVLTTEEINMLSPLAVAAGLASDLPGAEKLIINRGKAYGCTIESAVEEQETAPEPEGSGPPSPPRPSGPPAPPRSREYSHDDGAVTTHNLTAEEVAEKVRAAPEKSHVVWTKGMENWVAVADVDAIYSLVQNEKG